MTFIDIQGREMVLSFRGPRDVLGELSFAHAEPRSSTVGRVAARLIELCERYGDETADGVEIRLPITQEDLGSWIASSRAGVAGALRTMLELGWIRTERRRLTVLDLEALAQRAGSRRRTVQGLDRPGVQNCVDAASPRLTFVVRAHPIGG